MLTLCRNAYSQELSFLDQYNPVWNSPSANAGESMPFASRFEGEKTVWGTVLVRACPHSAAYREARMEGGLIP
tara:strand:+ start:85 stop:303 length:219 start_codon:yes stop_codon:yes gene_type:complete